MFFFPLSLSSCLIQRRRERASRSGIQLQRINRSVVSQVPKKEFFSSNGFHHLLISFGARATLADRNGRTALGIAIQNELVQACHALLPYYGNDEINRLTEAGDSYLHVACRKVSLIFFVLFCSFLF